MAIFPADIVQTDEIRERMEELETDHIDADDIMTDVGLWDESDRREYRGLAEVMQDLGDPLYNTVLIHERHLRDHIKTEWLETSGGAYAVGTRDGWESVSPEDLLSTWPFTCIDWDAATEDERSFYSVVEVDDVTYYYHEA